MTKKKTYTEKYFQWVVFKSLNWKLCRKSEGKTAITTVRCQRRKWKMYREEKKTTERMLTSRFIFAFSQWLCIKPFTTQTINRQIQRRRHFIQRFFTKFQWKCRLRLFQSFETTLYVEKDQTFVHVNRKIHETTTLSGIATKKKTVSSLQCLFTD